MKIAYVEIDTLLAQYNFCIDLNEGMVKKKMCIRDRVIAVTVLVLHSVVSAEWLYTAILFIFRQ